MQKTLALSTEKQSKLFYVYFPSDLISADVELLQNMEVGSSLHCVGPSVLMPLERWTLCVNAASSRAPVWFLYRCSSATAETTVLLFTLLQ